MISIGRRAILTVNILTVCLACASLAEYEWIRHIVFGKSRVDVVILLPLILLFVIRSRVISIVFFVMHGLLFVGMTNLARAAYVGNEKASYLSGSSFIQSAVFVLSILIVGLYLVGWALDRLLVEYFRRFGKKR